MKTGKRTLYRAVLLLCSGLYLQLGHALSLGNVEIESFLNQPLSFAIPVNKSSSERWQAGDVLVSLADSDTYHQLGLAYPWALGDIYLNVEDGAEGQLLIRGRSKKVVRELLVALLIRVEWPKGSIQKEYTALIDVNGVTNVAPKPTVVSLAPAPIQLSVQQGADSQSVVVQPFSGEASVVEVEPASTDIERLVVSEQQITSEEPASDVVLVEAAVEPGTQEPKQADDTGYPSQDPVYLYKVARGDILSVLAQRFRGAVELPLHRYIHSINNENIDQYPEGMAELSIGQLIRIPNPERVAKAYTYSSRQLLNTEENTRHHLYRVRYGDSLFLIAQAFKPKGVSTEDFIQTLVADNPKQLSSASQALRPRVELRIANENYVKAIQTEPAAPEAEEPIEQQPPESEIEVALEPLAPVLVPLVSKEVDEAYFTTSLVADDEFVNGGTTIDGRRSINPRLKANLREIEQYVGSDEKSLVYEVIQTNNRLPLLYEQVIRLNQKISDLQLDMAGMQVENKQLQQQLKALQQQQLDSGGSRSLQWFLLILVMLLLLACLFMYLYIRRLAKGLDFSASPVPVAVAQPAPADEKVEPSPTQSPRLKDLLAVRQKKAPPQPVVVGKQDYSQYDISKSNYDYSQAYDVGALEEKMKSGANAFEQTPATIEFETYAENLITVKRLVLAEEFVAAELLLDKLLATDSSQFDNWLVHLELQLKTRKQQEADALYVQLQQMFVEPEQLAALQHVMFPEPPVEKKVVVESLPELNDYPAPDADKLYEVRVYLSYSHLDMAELSLNSLLEINPYFPETLLLKLEWLAATGQQSEFSQLHKNLEQRRDELSDVELSALDKLLEETELVSTEDETATAFDDSTQILSQFDVEADEASADMTAILDEDFDLDELEELSEDAVIEAENDDEKEFLAAIQKQMESYTSDEQAEGESSDKASIPDDIRIRD